MSKFKIGDHVVFHKGKSYEGTGIIFSKGMNLWNIEEDIGKFWHLEESDLEIITATEKTYPIDLINEYLAYNDMHVIEPLVFDKWVTWKQTRLESLKESVVKMQQEISALEAQLK